MKATVLMDLSQVRTEVDKEDEELFQMFRNRKRCDDALICEAGEEMFLVSKSDIEAARKFREDMAIFVYTALTCAATGILLTLAYNRVGNIAAEITMAGTVVLAYAAFWALTRKI